MHIGMLTACYEPVVNGVTQMVALYDRHLSAAGHQVTIFTLGAPSPGEDSSKVLRSPGVPLGKTGYHFSSRYSRVAQKRLREVDILHCHHLLMGLDFASRYGRKPVVFTNHTRYDIYLSAYGGLHYGLANMIMRQVWPRMTAIADVVIAPSASIRRVMRESGVRAPIELIENGVEIERFQRYSGHLTKWGMGIPTPATVYIYVGRLSREKNIERLVDEFKLAVDQTEHLHLLLVGAGPMEAKLKRRVASLGLADRVHFIGQVKPAAVPSILAIGSAFVTASLSEVHPLAVIESLAAGVPVIAINSPGIADVVTHARSGLLTDGSPGSLAAAMTSLAGNGGLKRRLAAGARMAGQRYDIRLTVERTVSLYRRLIDGTYRRTVSEAGGGGSYLKPQSTAGHRAGLSAAPESAEQRIRGQ